ncbi:MAG: thiamine phosphate synthase, partial [Nitrospirae bacterium CG_4_9_14_3_um_filter_44_28]
PVVAIGGIKAENLESPVVAIGGIKAENLESVIDSGADAVAVSSGILKGNISENIRRFLNILKK